MRACCRRATGRPRPGTRRSSSVAQLLARAAARTARPAARASPRPPRPYGRRRRGRAPGRGPARSGTPGARRSARRSRCRSADQVVLVGALVDHEEDVDLVERLDRLHRQVVRVAGADPDQTSTVASPSRLPAAPGGRVEVAVRELAAAEHLPDDDDRGPRGCPAARTCSAMSPSVPRSTSSSGRLARATTATGQSAP